MTHVAIDQYRSVEHVEITMPENRPLVLFGPNNAGKSNIISAIDRALGSRWPLTLEFEDSDFYMRDREKYPDTQIELSFDGAYFTDRYGNPYSTVQLYFNVDPSKSEFRSADDRHLYVSSASRAQIQSYLVDAERDISRQLSYYSKYSLLSKFAHAIHNTLNDGERASLEDAYESIKSTFEGVPRYSEFFGNFHEVMENSVKGFVHDLKVDFSAYDPNNFAKSMRIVAYEGESVRSFEEFGTGEQQILLIAFAKAYVQTFGTGSLVLIIEEPEAHLHPLAQRWLKEYIYQLCGEGLQIILSTHSPDFLDLCNLDGLVRVWKNEQGITETMQLSKTDLVKFCRETGVSADKISEDNVLNFYGTKLFPDEAKGFFATKVLLAEGSTEYHALPVLMRTLGHSLTQEGIELVNARGKTSIPLYWRLFSAFGIECACIFDADDDANKEAKKANGQLSALLGIDVSKEVAGLGGPIYIADGIAFFRKDFECFMRASVPGYAAKEEEQVEVYGNTSKPGKARAVCCQLKKSDLPDTLEKLWQRTIKPCSPEGHVSEEQVEKQMPWEAASSDDAWFDEDIPF